MDFTPYIWQLYHESEHGKKHIQLFRDKEVKALSKALGFPYLFYPDEHNVKKLGAKKESINVYRQVYDYALAYLINDAQQARDFFNSMVVKGYFAVQFPLADESGNLPFYLNQNNYEGFFNAMAPITLALHHAHPDYFLPFLYAFDQFHEFIRLCETFNIVLPSFPARNKHDNRVLYYMDFCETLHEFRQKKEIGTLEFSAFLYDFGFNMLSKKDEGSLPKPTRAWFMGSGPPDYAMLDEATKDTYVIYGAGSKHVKTGDIIVVYCTIKRKSIHSIWRAIGDSYINPFDKHYYLVPVKFPVHVKPITYRELKNNKIFQHNATVRGKMQGLNGRPINQHEYAELLRLQENKNMDISLIPRLPYYESNETPIENERDVEINMIDPLLKRLKLKETDWMRQLPLRMGRGIRYYPDYAVFANTKEGEETARHIIEAKYSITTDEQLHEAFIQARSYAYRLQARSIWLADRDFLWIFQRQKGRFPFSYSKRYSWKACTEPDTLHALKTILNA